MQSERYLASTRHTHEPSDAGAYVTPASVVFGCAAGPLVRTATWPNAMSRTVLPSAEPLRVDRGSASHTTNPPSGIETGAPQNRETYLSGNSAMSEATRKLQSCSSICQRGAATAR